MYFGDVNKIEFNTNIKFYDEKFIIDLIKLTGKCEILVIKLSEGSICTLNIKKKLINLNIKS